MKTEWRTVLEMVSFLS